MTATSLFFPGITDADSVRINYRVGIAPSTITVSCPIAKVLDPRAGTVIVSYPGESLIAPFVLTLHDCVVSDFTMDDQGMATITILDRRWKWRYPTVSGWYNRRKKSGTAETLIASTVKTPQELASILLDAMGEQNYSVSSLPDTPYRPEYRWEHENAAAQLEALCTSLGCRVVLGLDNRVKIWRNGYGHGLPLTPDQLPGVGQLSITSQAVPASVTVLSAPVKIQTRWALQAVAEELDGSLVPVMFASYCIAAGGYYTEDVGNILDPDDYAKASKSVFRYYRIVGHATGFNQVSGSISYAELSDVDFLDEMVDSNDDNSARKPECMGIFYGGTPAQSVTTRRWEEGITIEKERQLVVFSKPCFRYIDDLPAPALMYLETGCNVRDESGSFYRYRFTQNVPGSLGLNSTKTEVHIRESILGSIRNQWFGLNNFVGEVNSSIATLAELERAATEIANSYQPLPGVQKAYAGIRAVELDGYRDSVAWSFGKSQAPITAVSCYSQMNPYLPDERELRDNRATREVVRQAAARQFAAWERRR